MADSNVFEKITMDAVVNLLVENGYNVTDGGEENCVFVKDTDSSVTFTCVLENEILFNTVACIELDNKAISNDLMRKLLDADNGISTSSFQLYNAHPEKTLITLNNFCKLQDLGPEDQDDVLSCLEFLNVDVLGARQVLGDFI